jgi:hypothetical protein
MAFVWRRTVFTATLPIFTISVPLLMIAISYRREDSLPIAGRLYDRLKAKFGQRNIFMDFDSIPPGADFRERIRQTIERSDVVIAVIGPHWLGEESDGFRRIDDPTDFVRLEIEYALRGNIPVIPVLINNTVMPKPDKLPTQIEPLAFRNALPLDSGLDFHNHADRLINGLSKITASSQRPFGTVPTLRSSRNLLAGVVIVSVTAVAVAGFFLFQANRQSHVESHPVQSGVKSIEGSKEEGARNKPEPAKPSLPRKTSPTFAMKAAPSALGQRSTGNEYPTDLASRMLEPELAVPSVVPSAAVSISPTNDADTQKLSRVYIKKYDISALIPTNIFPDAAKLSTTDEDFLLATDHWTMIRFFQSSKTLQEDYANWTAKDSKLLNGRTVEYKIMKNGWFVVSGTGRAPGSEKVINGFYRKEVKKGDKVIGMHLRYNEDSCPISEDTLTVMSRAFDGN